MTTTERATPSPQAMRAARAILNDSILGRPQKEAYEWCVREVAAIIDRETGVADLADALRKSLAYVEGNEVVFGKIPLSDELIQLYKRLLAKMNEADAR